MPVTNIDYCKATNKYELDIEIRNYIEYKISFTRYFFTADLCAKDGDPENTINYEWEDGYLDNMNVVVKIKEEKIIMIPAEEFLGLFNQVCRKQYIIETKASKVYLRYVLN